MNENEHTAAAGMKPAEILERLQGDSAALFDDLARQIARGKAGDLDAPLLSLPWRSFSREVAATLALAGKTLDDLATAVSARVKFKEGG